MAIAKKKIVDYIVSCYDFVEQEFSEIFNKEKYFIVSNRGTYAFISIIGSLNKFETQKGTINKATSNDDRFNAIKPYLQSLMTDIENLSNEEASKQLALLGAGADTKWLRFFQNMISSKHPEYNPPELVDWKERQIFSYQEQGRKYVKEIEKHMKTVILGNLKKLFGENWKLEINSIRTACEGRANDENEKNYKEGIEKRVEWTEMFGINDYKIIIEKNWTKTPDTEDKSFKNFQEHFSIKIGEGRNKKDLLKWMSTFNSHRNQLAHEGSKKEGINKNDVDFLAMVHKHFCLDTNSVKKNHHLL